MFFNLTATAIKSQQEIFDEKMKEIFARHPEYKTARYGTLKRTMSDPTLLKTNKCLIL
jgi:hypothetical protein